MRYMRWNWWEYNATPAYVINGVIKYAENEAIETEQRMNT